MQSRNQLSINDFFKSSLTQAQNTWHIFLGTVLALLLANTLFLLARRYLFGCDLAAVAACNVSEFYQAAVLLHSALGILLVLAVGIFGLLHIPSHFKLAQIRPQLLMSGILTLVALSILLWSGLHFLVHAKTAQMNWLYNAHLIAAVGLAAIYFLHRFWARPKRANGILISAIVVIFLLTAPLVGTELWMLNHAKKIPTPKTTAILDDGKFHPLTWVDPQQPFFPSPVSLASGKDAVPSSQLLTVDPTPEKRDSIRQEVKADGFNSKTLVGAEKCVRCHADTVEQWASSVHRFSSFNNPFYVATLEYLRDTPIAPNEFMQTHLSTFNLAVDMTGRIKSRWCAGCHDPLLMLTGGKMLQTVDKGSVEAQAGLTCLSCHLIKDIPNRTGNGNYVWDDQFKDSYIFSRHDNDLGMVIHDTYLKANPERHKADMLKSFYRKADYCATCHKVSLDRPVNEYRWLRGQNEFDAWHNSGIPHNAARTFYLPPSVRQCQDCHMPLVESKSDLAAKNGMIRSHRFVAANSALAWLRGDTQEVERTSKFLSGKALRAFIGGVVLDDGKIVPVTDGAAHSLPGNLERLELDVVVRNLNVGHTFPAGTNDSNEAWIEITATGKDKTFTAGAMQADGKINENTRIYNALLVNRMGQRIDKRNAHEMVTSIYVAVIPPSSSDLSRFSIPISQLGDLTAGATVKVRLLWRKFNRVYTDFAYNANKPGFAKLNAAPDLPITEIATEELSIKRDGTNLVIQAPPPPQGVESPALLHDYAIGFLLQGDLKQAKQVVETLLALTPDCVNCLRTRARIEIAEGQFDAARQTLTQAEKLAPSDPQNAWQWAQVLLQEGNYADAGAALQRVLEAFPEDRMAHKLMARVAYLDGRFQDAVAAVNKALAIDPEDATAYYYAMLAQRALGNNQEETKAQAAYEYYKTDETAQQATLAFRQNDSEANFAAQKIKVFELQ